MADVLDSKIANLSELLAGLDPRLKGGVDTVQGLRMIAQTAESAQRQAVAQARAEGATWEQVARALGMSRQGAWERFASES